jgi:hypothetical protein
MYADRFVFRSLFGMIVPDNVRSAVFSQPAAGDGGVRKMGDTRTFLVSIGNYK